MPVTICILCGLPGRHVPSFQVRTVTIPAGHDLSLCSINKKTRAKSFQLQLKISWYYSLTDWVIRKCLFLIHLFSTIISPRQCHHHHSYHPSNHHSSIPNSKLSYFSNPTLHRHLAPLRTDFTDTRTALRLFPLFQFFPVFSYRYFLPF